MKEHPEEFYLQEQHPTIRRLADLIEAAEPPQMSSKSTVRWPKERSKSACIAVHGNELKERAKLTVRCR